MRSLLCGELFREIVHNDTRGMPLNSRGGSKRPKGFSFVELLVVIAIMAILATIVSNLVPSLLRGNQMDSNVNTLAGILEEAREAATANNTYIWVAFTAPIAGSPAAGTWVGTIQSQDGTDSAINTGTPTAPTWLASITVPGPNLILHSKLQNLPGVGIVQHSRLNGAAVATVFAGARDDRSASSRPS